MESAVPISVHIMAVTYYVTLQGWLVREDSMQTTEALTREAWRGYQCGTFPEGSWVSEGDMLRTVAEATCIDLITRHQYRHFTLELEWRVASGGNSGVIYRVSEALPHA
jgi:hypothetical protein